MTLQEDPYYIVIVLFTKSETHRITILCRDTVAMYYRVPRPDAERRYIDGNSRNSIPKSLCQRYLKSEEEGWWPKTVGATKRRIINPHAVYRRE